MCMVILPVCISVHNLCDQGGRKQMLDLWNWSYHASLSSMWVLAVLPRSSERAART